VSWELAQVNVGRLLAPIDDPQIASFVAALDEINALADASPGFVWRLQTEDGDATSIRPTDDDLLLINMSVWQSADALADYVYRSGHVEVMRRRRQWFEPYRSSYMALWWVLAGQRPTEVEAFERLALLDERGPTVDVFTFRQRFPAPGSAGPTARTDDRDSCPA
jgi:Domain of unknown function (DUF3291)